MDEFSHHGADGDHGWFAVTKETLAEDTPPFGSVKSDDGRHIESLTQESMSDLGQARSAFNAGTRFVLSGIEARVGGGLAGVVKAGEIGKVSQQDSGGAFPDARDGVEQLLFCFQILIAVNVFIDRLGKVLNILVEPLKVLHDVRPHGISGDFQAVGFLNAHGL